MRFSTLFLLVGLLLPFTGASAAGLALSDRDCIDILERWAADPSSVPQHLVDECRKMQGAGTAAAAGSPVPDIKPAAGKQVAADPCSGPDAANSVHCWGAWKSLAPAAGRVTPASFASIGPPTVCPDLSEECAVNLAQIQEPLPLGGCSPGESCGFATLGPGLSSQPGDSSTIEVVPFGLVNDGSQFMVDPGGTGEIISVANLQSPPIPGPPARFEGINGDVESKLITNIRKDDAGKIDLATGIWRHGNLTNQDGSNTHSGVFAWGVASTQTTLDSLNNGGAGISVGFSGVMLRDPNTSADITVNFGSQPNWTGNWSNSVDNHQFSAGGNVSGVNLASDPTQFSTNVQGNSSFVQGVLLGERGDLSVGHAVDVNLISGENIKDVGLLRQR